MCDVECSTRLVALLLGFVAAPAWLWPVLQVVIYLFALAFVVRRLTKLESLHALMVPCALIRSYFVLYANLPTNFS